MYMRRNSVIIASTRTTDYYCHQTFIFNLHLTVSQSQATGHAAQVPGLSRSQAGRVDTKNEISKLAATEWSESLAEITCKSVFTRYF